MGPYTTFQQLPIALPLPLDTLAEECVILPTYKSLLEYKVVYETESHLTLEVGHWTGPRWN